MIAEQPVVVGAGSETLEARLAIPQGARLGVVICHPHPLYGGDMDSPVVAAIAEAGVNRKLATLRFNFRGVGASSGRHEDGIGEQQDVRAALALLGDRLGGPERVALAGYSFGAVMAAMVAATTPVAGLALVAPPIRVTQLATPARVAGPVTVIVGAEDQYCPPDSLDALSQALPGATILVIDGADHFFFGTLGPLGEAVESWADALPVA
jgi:alpha/beta superfamily hydrolase